MLVIDLFTLILFTIDFFTVDKAIFVSLSQREESFSLKYEEGKIWGWIFFYAGYLPTRESSARLK